MDGDGRVSLGCRFPRPVLACLSILGRDWVLGMVVVGGCRTGCGGGVGDGGGVGSGGGDCYMIWSEMLETVLRESRSG